MTPNVLLFTFIPVLIEIKRIIEVLRTHNIRILELVTYWRFESSVNRIGIEVVFRSKGPIEIINFVSVE